MAVQPQRSAIMPAKFKSRSAASVIDMPAVGLLPEAGRGQRRKRAGSGNTGP
jgi:hypothetical protein